MVLCLLAVQVTADAPFPITFEDVASSTGVDFVLQNSPTPQKHLIETMPGGMAILDYNGDGRPDLFFANGAAVPSLEKSDSQFHNRLYRNEGNWRFRDVTAQAGLAGAGYSMGAAAADFDNDGHPDLFVPGVRHQTLYRNRGDGTFEDITAQAGIRDGQWAVGAGWFDYDNDGRLDLWVVNYAQWSPAFDKYCGDQARQIRVYCHPRFFSGLASTLYRNLGNGRFADVSKAAGIDKHIGRGMSVAFADYDGDGFVDVFVPNDKLPNFLFHNLGGKRFEEVGLLAGVALPDHGKSISGMGADFDDLDQDGLPDIFLTALNGETFPYFRNLGKGQFTDATFASRIGPASLKVSGWGTGMYDFDNDGRKDLFVAASHVNDRIESFESTAYKQRNLVLRQTPQGFTAAPIGEPRAHRATAVADLDGDGRLDVVVTSLGEPVELWRNTSQSANWLAIGLEGSSSNRDGLGAIVYVGKQANTAKSTVGYASSSLGPIHIGLGAQSTAGLEVRWPSGKRQPLKGVKANQVLRLKEPGP